MPRERISRFHQIKSNRIFHNFHNWYQWRAKAVSAFFLETFLAKNSYYQTLFHKMFTFIWTWTHTYKTFFLMSLGLLKTNAQLRHRLLRAPQQAGVVGFESQFWKLRWSFLMVQNNLLTLPFSRTLLGYCQSQRDIMLRLIFDIVSFKKGKTLANSYIIARDLRESISIKGNLTTLSLCHGTLGHAKGNIGMICISVLCICEKCAEQNCRQRGK
mgnify:CR=1 FL=1